PRRSTGRTTAASRSSWRAPRPRSPGASSPWPPTSTAGTRATRDNEPRHEPHRSGSWSGKPIRPRLAPGGTDAVPPGALPNGGRFAVGHAAGLVGAAHRPRPLRRADRADADELLGGRGWAQPAAPAVRGAGGPVHPHPPADGERLAEAGGV